jgi:hypothetical protein
VGGGAGVEPVTVTVTEEVKNPSRVVAVIVVEPAETPVTRPEAETVAVAEEEYQVTPLFVALAFVVAVNCVVAFTATLRMPETDTVVTGFATKAARLGTKVEPFTDPRPVQLSYPAEAEYAPFVPTVTS